MELKDYLLGKRIVLHSPLRPDEIARRINEASNSVFSPFSRGVAGWSKLRRVSLRWKLSFFDDGYRSKLWGRLEESDRFTTLHARYGAARSMRIFLVFWYAVLALMLAASIGALTSGRDDAWETLLFLVALLFFGAFPLLLAAIFNRNSEQHLRQILAFLEAEAQLTTNLPDKRRKRWS